jgi:predicted dehydrogenase/threonine dehydrogenase-like Zn-dependent dehydrogenase
MRQVIQNIRSGKLALVESPAPCALPGHVLVANRCSLISPGTEKMLRDLARKSLWGKARERPDHVRRVIEKIRAEGLWNTLRQVAEKLDDPMPLGYCAAGHVVQCGLGVQDLKPGDRVATNGPHAEIVCVPRNLCARVPDQVQDEQAAFSVLAAIALQGVRLSQVALGETALVIGLGLVGQMTVALLAAAGARVLGTDLDPNKCELAMRMGAAIARPGLSGDDVLRQTGELGADVVLITAGTTSDGPITLAGDAVRKKGRVVAVGAVGLQVPRRSFYFKEAELVVSCSYGPGRYDPEYEERGHDYPAAYVRWTEQRNMQAVLALMETGKLDVSPLISHRFALHNAEAAYELIEQNQQPYLGIILNYSPPAALPCITTRPAPPTRLAAGQRLTTIGVGCLGAGNFARQVLLPALRANPRLVPQSICSLGGKSAAHVGRKVGFSVVARDQQQVLEDPRVNAVFVLTRHNQHARQVVAALKHGKHVFVEKPLCLTWDELVEIERQWLAASERGQILMVGFNRRFSPAARAMKQFFADVTGPRTLTLRFNAGAIPSDHWIQNEQEGGGRIIGEACHGIDLATYLIGAPPVRVFAESIGGSQAPNVTDDQCLITVRHADGSISSIAYLAGGDRACPKERVEMFGGGRVAICDDFRSVESWSGGRRRRLLRGKPDKGHREELQAFATAILDGGPPPIAWHDLRDVTLASLLAVYSLRTGAPLELSAAHELPQETPNQERLAG